MGGVVRLKKGRKKEEELRVLRVTVQVTEREKELISRLASRQGLDVAAYIRKLCIYDQWDKLGSDYL